MAAKSETSSSAPLYKQLEESFVQDIVCGRLKPGDAVPSTYSLAEQYGISRVTAVRCYEQLKARGYLTARRGGATIVNPSLPAALDWNWSSGGSLAAPNELEAEFDICRTESPSCLQLPPHEVLPSKAWLRAMGAVLDEPLPDFFGRAGQNLTMRLKMAIAAFLSRNRGMSLYPQNVLLFNTKRDALSFVARHVVEEGAGVAVESPGEPLAREVFSERSAKFFAMAVDREGAVIDHLPPGAGIKMMVVSPSAQFPSGVVLSERRRQQVARYAGHNDAFILEDDGAALMRFGKSPEPCLFNKFKNALHIGSFGAYLGPLCQISYLIVPDHILAAPGNIVESGIQPRLEMLVLANFIETGALDLSILRMRAQLAQRRQQLLALLQSDFKEMFAVGAGSTGYHQVVRVNSVFSREKILSSIENSKLQSYVLQKFYAEDSETSRLELMLPLVENQRDAGVVEKLHAFKHQLLEVVPQAVLQKCETMSQVENMPFPAAAQFSQLPLTI